METGIVLSQCKILGKDRRYGEELSSDDLAKIPHAVKSALVGSNMLKIATSDDERYERMSARIDRLNEMVVSLEKKIPMQRRPGRPKKENSDG